MHSSSRITARRAPEPGGARHVWNRWVYMGPQRRRGTPRRAPAARVSGRRATGMRRRPPPQPRQERDGGIRAAQMPFRDITFLLIWLYLIPASLIRPWIGIL